MHRRSARRARDRRPARRRRRPARQPRRRAARVLRAVPGAGSRRGCDAAASVGVHQHRAARHAVLRPRDALRPARGRVVLDINPFSLDAVRRAGVPAVHLPLGYVPSMDRWGGDRRAARRSTSRSWRGARRGGSRSSAAPAGCCGSGAPICASSAGTGPSRDKRPRSSLPARRSTTALAGTRILLNVHRGDEPYFEWARVVEAVANGCVVATRDVGRHRAARPRASTS